MADKKATLKVQEYNRSLNDWMEAMQLPSDLKAQIAKAQIVLLPAEYHDCPTAFANDAVDFLNYCQQKKLLAAEICCTDDNFSQLEMCSVKINLGRIFAGTKDFAKKGTIIIFWNVLSCYIYDKVKDFEVQPAPTAVIEKPAYMEHPECSFSVIVKDTDGKHIEVEYDGPVSEIEQVRKTIIQLTTPEEQEKAPLSR